MKHRDFLNKSLLFIAVTVLYFSVVANTKIAPHIVFPGKGICRESWAKKIEQESSVRLEYEFLDKDGKVLAPERTPYRINPMQFCSGNLARVGPEKKVQIVTAGHCVKDKFRKDIESKMKRKEGVQNGTAPIEAMNIRLVARVGGRDPGITLTDAQGPTVVTNTTDSTESYRKNDFVISGSSSHNLDELFKDKALPELCDPKMTQEDINKAAVIGYGLTNNNALSKEPLCAEQKIGSINNGIITIQPYQLGSPGACPGDSGGGLWIVPKNSSTPCLAGVVSGPRSSSLKTRSPETFHQAMRAATDQCTKVGVEAIFSSVYQQQDVINGYLQPAADGDETTPSRKIQ